MARVDWHTQMRRDLNRHFDRLIFDVYYIRFKECGNSGTVHEYLKKTRGEGAPHRNTVYAALKRLAAISANFRP